MAKIICLRAAMMETWQYGGLEDGSASKHFVGISTAFVFLCECHLHINQICIYTYVVRSASDSFPSILAHVCIYMYATVYYFIAVSLF